LQYDEDGELFLGSSEETRKYVGNSSGVDQAWEVFNAGEIVCEFTSRWKNNSGIVQNIQLDPDIVNVRGLYIDGRNKVITIPDVFHQLHCLVSSHFCYKVTVLISFRAKFEKH
jgi:hypothetical protein